MGFVPCAFASRFHTLLVKDKMGTQQSERIQFSTENWLGQLGQPGMQENPKDVEFSCKSRNLGDTLYAIFTINRHHFILFYFILGKGEILK